MLMPFMPGQSGNPDGRKKGTPNRLTKRTRRFLTVFLEEDQEQAREDWNTLKPYERWMVRTRLYEFVTPKMQRTETSFSFENISDEQVDQIMAILEAGQQNSDD